MKATAIAPSNIAFTKYWGKHVDPTKEALRIPRNSSISMCLSNLLTTTTVEFSDQFSTDTFILNGEVEDGENARALKHIDRIRALAQTDVRVRIESNNNFPKGTGLSSSASGFAALTVAGAKAAGMDLSEKELSILARQGSGSAARSIPSGFVEWHAGETGEESFAETIFPDDHWAIADVVAIVSEGKKEIGTTEGMKSVKENPFIDLRITRMRQKNAALKQLMVDKNFAVFGDLIEQEALELHALMLSSGLIYLQPGTLQIMRLCKYQWRPQGLSVYFTINTGQDIHLICEEKNIEAVQEKLKKLDIVRSVIVNRPSVGTRLMNEHLF